MLKFSKSTLKDMEEQDREKLNRVFHELEKRIERLEERVDLLEQKRA